MCYGQTGSGKTFTFFGPESETDFTEAETPSITLPESTGIVLRTCQELL
eukprot:gene41029-50761_t